MSSTVTTRPSHYDVLGLAPTASAEDIARAFARELGKPRAFGGIADISVAYEVLRDPARRKAYDSSIGLTPKAKPEAESFRSTMAWHARAQFVPNAAPALRTAATETQPPEPAEPQGDTALPPFIANRLRDLAEPSVRDRAPVAVEEPHVETIAAPEPEPQRSIQLTLADQAEGERVGAQWKKIGIGVGVLALVAAVSGAWAGWDANKGAPKTDAATQSALLSPPTTFSVDDPANTDPKIAEALNAPTPIAAPRHSEHVAARVAPRARRKQPNSQLTDLDRQLAEPSAPAPAITADAAAPAHAVTASMPLSNSTIARTIGKIGYPCGSVASTSQVLGGVYTVTCTSGHTYRAAPVRGRYHFRRVNP